MAAPWIDEMYNYIREHGDRDDCERDLLMMADALGVPLDSLLGSFNNAIHKGFLVVSVPRAPALLPVREWWKWQKRRLRARKRVLMAALKEGRDG